MRVNNTRAGPFIICIYASIARGTVELPREARERRDSKGIGSEPIHLRLQESLYFREHDAPALPMKQFRYFGVDFARQLPRQSGRHAHHHVVLRGVRSDCQAKHQLAETEENTDTAYRDRSRQTCLNLIRENPWMPRTCTLLPSGKIKYLLRLDSVLGASIMASSASIITKSKHARTRRRRRMPGIPSTRLRQDFPLSCAPFFLSDRKTRRGKKLGAEIHRVLYRIAANAGRYEGPWIKSDFNAAGMRSTLRGQCSRRGTRNSLERQLTGTNWPCFSTGLTNL